MADLSHLFANGWNKKLNQKSGFHIRKLKIFSHCSKFLFGKTFQIVSIRYNFYSRVWEVQDCIFRCKEKTSYDESASCEGCYPSNPSEGRSPLHTPYRDILCHRIHLSTNANTAQNTRNSARRFLSLCLWRCTVSFLLLPRSKTCLLRL